MSAIFAPWALTVFGRAPLHTRTKPRNRSKRAVLDGITHTFAQSSGSTTHAILLSLSLSVCLCVWVCLCVRLLVCVCVSVCCVQDCVSIIRAWAPLPISHVVLSPHSINAGRVFPSWRRHRGTRRLLPVREARRHRASAGACS